MSLHLIEQITVVDASGEPPQTRDVLIDDDRFVVVSPHIEANTFRVDERTDGRGKLLIPGLVNAHHHSHDRFDKGRFSPLPLELWMSLYNPPTHQRGWTADEVYLRTLLNGTEMLRGGITTVVDDIHFGGQLEPDLVEAAFRAYQALGIRADVGVAWSDRPFHEAIPHLTEALPESIRQQTAATRIPVTEVFDLWRDLARTWSGRVRFVVSASAPHRCSDEFLTRAWALAAETRLPVHVHVLETRIQSLAAQRMYGTSMVEHMRRLGTLTANAVLAHGVWMSDSDLEAVAAAGATIVHNPACNMKLGSGIAPVAAMLAHGINVALGTDNNNGNDSNSMFDAMRLAAFAGALVSSQPDAPIDAPCCLRMATTGGAGALGRANELGRIARGELADFCILDTSTSAYTPPNDLHAQLVFCEQGHSVRQVFVAGRKLVDEGRITSIDEQGLAREIAERLTAMHGKVLAGATHAEQLRPYLESAFRNCLAEPDIAELIGACNLNHRRRLN
jgi:5-methylthioadenosine/S-adenosylhomocysteine deaminase